MYKQTHTGSDSKNRVSKHEVHEPLVHDEDLPVPAKEVGNYSRILNIFNGSIEDKNVLIWRMFMSSSMKEHELRGNSELVQNHTEIDTGTS